MTVWNNDATAGGGNGLIVFQSGGLPPFPEYDKVAALQVVAAGGQTASSPYTGAYGAIIKSEAYRGMYVQGAEIDEFPGFGYYAAVFDSTDGIQLIGGGSCIGCTTAYSALNSGVGGH